MVIRLVFCSSFVCSFVVKWCEDHQKEDHKMYVMCADNIEFHMLASKPTFVLFNTFLQPLWKWYDVTLYIDHEFIIMFFIKLDIICGSFMVSIGCWRFSLFNTMFSCETDDLSLIFIIEGIWANYFFICVNYQDLLLSFFSETNHFLTTCPVVLEFYWFLVFTRPLLCHSKHGPTVTHYINQHCWW